MLPNLIPWRGHDCLLTFQKYNTKTHYLSQHWSFYKIFAHPIFFYIYTPTILLLSMIVVIKPPFNNLVSTWILQYLSDCLFLRHAQSMLPQQSTNNVDMIILTFSKCNTCCPLNTHENFTHVPYLNDAFSNFQLFTSSWHHT